ncbi:MAG TPA: O-antigen ligase family protein [Pyrinomonadaceae bacterium]|nr:O-antigen ligase family protein [Pyrinomonadaceae bacterium]
MRKKPEVDYEGVFPSKFSRPRESAPPEPPLTPDVVFTPSGAAAIPSHAAPGISAASVSGEAVVVPGKEKKPKPSFMELEAGQWTAGRGHGVTFICLFIFSVVLFLRPYELIPALSSFKTMAFWVGIVTLAVFAVTQVAIDGNLTARPREVNMVLLFGLGALLSIPLAIDRAEAWEEFTDIVIKTLLIFIVIVNVVRTEWRVRLLWFLVLGVSIYLSVNVIADYQAGVFKIGAAETNTQRVAGAIRGLFDNSNDLALHLVTMIPIAFALGIEKKSLSRKLVYFPITLLMVAAVIITFSRGGFLGLIAMTLVLARKLSRRNKSAALATLVLGVIFFLAVAPASYSGRLATIFDSASDITGSSSQRTQVLKRSILVALRYPLFGVGIGNFHHKSFQELGTHNAYTQVGAETGIPAMIAYIIFLVHPLRKLRLMEREMYERNDTSRFYYLSIGLQASLVGFMVASFFAAVAYQWYIYYLVGYAIALRRVYYLEQQQKMSQAAT